MHWLGRLLHRRAGQIPSRLLERLSAFTTGDPIGTEVLAEQHNQSVRAIQSLQRRMEIFETENRVTVGRIDTLEGLPNSTMGDASGTLNRRLRIVEQRLADEEAQAVPSA